MSSNGWSLSPAYDLNPSTDKDGLALNIDMDNNALDFELAISVGQYFQLTLPEMKVILEQVKSVVSNWRKVATQIGIAKQEQNLMEAAFRWRRSFMAIPAKYSFISRWNYLYLCHFSKVY